MRSTFIAEVLAVLLISSTPAPADRSIRIFYVDFNFETYSSITTKDIQRVAQCKFDVAFGSADAIALQRILAPSDRTPGFADLDVRLLVQGIDGGPTYVNKLFQVYWSGMGKSSSLAKEARKQLEALMDRLAEAASCGRFEPAERFKEF